MTSKKFVSATRPTVQCASRKNIYSSKNNILTGSSSCKELNRSKTCETKVQFLPWDDSFTKCRNAPQMPVPKTTGVNTLAHLPAIFCQLSGCLLNPIVPFLGENGSLPIRTVPNACRLQLRWLQCSNFLQATLGDRHGQYCDQSLLKCGLHQTAVVRCRGQQGVCVLQATR